jgi:hypothetical protein
MALRAARDGTTHPITSVRIQAMVAASSSIKSADETGYPLARAQVPSTPHLRSPRQ